MFRQNTSSPKTWSLTCCKKWTWKRDASKFGELILWVACSTKTLLSTRIKAFHIFPHIVASNVVFHQKYVLLRKRLPLSCHKNSSQIFDATKLWKHTIPLTYNTKTLISNISETHRFSPQMRLTVYPDHKTTLNTKKSINASTTPVTRILYVTSLKLPSCFGPVDNNRGYKCSISLFLLNSCCLKLKLYVLHTWCQKYMKNELSGIKKIKDTYTLNKVSWLTMHVECSSRFCQCFRKVF